MDHYATSQRNSIQAFTLIELSIALVIIGLIVGGVMVGQDLIQSAQIRRTASRIEAINTAVNTFKLKYNGLPGDLANATRFFPGVTSGDGNGRIEFSWWKSGIGTVYEAVLFQQQLSLAGLIEGNYDGTWNSYLNGQVIASDVGGYLILSGAGNSNLYQVYANNYHSELMTLYIADVPKNGIQGMSCIQGMSWDNCSCRAPGAITQSVAFRYDTKFDDGIVSTGRIRSWSEWPGGYCSYGSGSTKCIVHTLVNF
jgi:prepilin-type N-terminal cleavage/methylation domain-containing protein